MLQKAAININRAMLQKKLTPPSKAVPLFARTTNNSRVIIILNTITITRISNTVSIDIIVEHVNISPPSLELLF